MADLSTSLGQHDLGFLHIVAELWGIQLPSESTGDHGGINALSALKAALLDPELLREIIDSLPAEARKALDELIQHNGRVSWPLFTRRYGEIRQMGPGRRDRELPHRKPISASEILWYRALIARNFLDTPDGPQEFAYIPSDLLKLMPSATIMKTAPLGRPAHHKEYAHVLSVNDHILDDACTLLSALRLGLSLDTDEFRLASWQPNPPLSPDVNALRSLLVSATLVDPVTSIPNPDLTRKFLELPRGDALAELVEAWIHSLTFNELHLLPGLRFEGDWQNDPLRARQAILGLLSAIPIGKWWSVSAFIDGIKQTLPDFLRPTGDYDSWFIFDVAANRYLRGIDYWDRVDGEVIRYLLTGPLHWLGILDLGSPAASIDPQAFRVSAWANSLLRGESPGNFSDEVSIINISSDGKIVVPRLASRAVRYQAARFSRWEAAGDEFIYRITSGSLMRAKEQGLNITQIITLLRRYTSNIPPSLVTALERWERAGSEARMEQALILRLRTPEMLQALRKSRVARFLGDPLGPTVVIVKPGAREKVTAALAEMGYLTDIENLE